MAVFVFAFLVAHQFEGTVGDHLVGIHVGRCAGTALYHVYYEMVVELAFTHLFTSGHDGVAYFGLEYAELAVGLRCSLFHHSQRFDENRVHVEPYAADVEVLHGTHGLYAEIVFDGDVLVAEQVVFDSRLTR